MFYKGSIAKSSGGAGGEAVWGDITGTLSDQTDLADALSAKQATLVSGTNIKTINDQSLLGSGNIAISGSVPNQNTAVGATNPLEFWEGTSAEYNTGGGSTTFYCWEGAGGLNIRNIGSADTTNNYLYNVVYGNNKFVTIGADKSVLSSTDTNNWNFASNIKLPEVCNALIFGNNIFVAFKINSTYLYVSSDAEAWTAVTGLSSNIKDIVFGNNYFLMGCEDKKFLRSSDAQTWTEVSSATYGILPVYIAGYNQTRMGYANGKFIFVDAVNTYGNSYPIKISADNGETWTLLDTVNALEPDYVWAYGVGDVLYWGADNTSKLSTDGGSTIETDSLYIYSRFQRIYASGMYYQINSSKIQSSNDGVTWSDVANINNNQKTITYGNNIILTVGSYHEYDSSAGQELYYRQIATYSENGPSVYTTDLEPDNTSTVYSEPGVVSALTITLTGAMSITCSDGVTYEYNSSGNQTVSQSVGEAHPDWICMIEGVGIKKGSTVIASVTTVDQIYNASSTNAQSGVAVASGISDTLGTIETALQGV